MRSVKKMINYILKDDNNFIQFNNNNIIHKINYFSYSISLYQKHLPGCDHKLSNSLKLYIYKFFDKMKSRFVYPKISTPSKGG